MKQAPAWLRFAAIAVDAPVFGMIDGKLMVLVASVNRPPHYNNIDGFIGGLIEPNETAEDAVERHLKEKAQVAPAYLEQLFTMSAVDRDKRNRVISVAYLGLVRPDTVATYHHESARFVPLKSAQQLAYDHDEILARALARLRGKLEYTNVVQFLLPRHFTLTELQTVYEVVFKKEFDKRNFRKKILALGMVRETGRTQEGVKNRPAMLYEFPDKKLKELPLLT